MRNAFAALALALLAALPAAAAAQSIVPTNVPTPRLMRTIAVKAPAAMLSLEVADTRSNSEFGLMYRTHLLAHTGMIFVFTDGPRSFWMKNTWVPLDMLFVAPDGRVNAIAAEVPATPLGAPDDKVARRSGRGAFVIELPAGEAVLDGIKPGTKLALPRLVPKD